MHGGRLTVRNLKKQFIMDYSLEKLTTVAECDALLALAVKDKESAERRRRNLGESIETFSKRLDDLNLELASVQLMLETFTPLYHALREGGKDKIHLTVAVKRLELRRAMLLKKALTCNVHALLSKQMRYNLLDRRVAAMADYITALQTRRTMLNVAPLRVARVVDLSRPAESRSGLLPVYARPPHFYLPAHRQLPPYIHPGGVALAANLEAKNINALAYPGGRYPVGLVKHVG